MGSGVGVGAADALGAVSAVALADVPAPELFLAPDFFAAGFVADFVADLVAAALALALGVGVDEAMGVSVGVGVGVTSEVVTGASTGASGALGNGAAVPLAAG